MYRLGNKLEKLLVVIAITSILMVCEHTLSRNCTAIQWLPKVSGNSNFCVIHYSPATVALEISRNKYIVCLRGSWHPENAVQSTSIIL